MDEIIKFRVTEAAKTKYVERARFKGFDSLSDWFRNLADQDIAGQKEATHQGRVPVRAVVYEQDEHSQVEPPNLSPVDRVAWLAFKKKMGRNPKSATELADYKESSGIVAELKISP